MSVTMASKHKITRRNNGKLHNYTSFEQEPATARKVYIWLIWEIDPKWTEAHRADQLKEKYLLPPWWWEPLRWAQERS